MKLLMVITLVLVSGWAQAYTVFWDLNQEPPVDGDGNYLYTDYRGYSYIGDPNEYIVTWGVDNILGEGATISYGFADENYTCGSASNCSPILSEDYQQNISDAFDAWTEVANLELNKVDMDQADIVVAYSDVPDREINGTEYNLLGLAYMGFWRYSGSGVNEIRSTNLYSGGVFFDEKDFTSDSVFSLFNVALHEVGHALGLGHSEGVNSIMYPIYSSTISSLQADDIAGIQFLYGASVSVVPEPSTYLLFLFGLAMVLGLGRRQRGR